MVVVFIPMIVIVILLLAGFVFAKMLVMSILYYLFYTIIAITLVIGVVELFRGYGTAYAA